MEETTVCVPERDESRLPGRGGCGGGDLKLKSRKGAEGEAGGTRGEAESERTEAFGLGSGPVPGATTGLGCEVRWLGFS